MRLRTAKDFRLLVVIGRAAEAKRLAFLDGTNASQGPPCHDGIFLAQRLVGWKLWARCNLAHYAGDLIKRRTREDSLDPFNLPRWRVTSRFAPGTLLNRDPGRLP